MTTTDATQQQPRRAEPGRPCLATQKALRCRVSAAVSAEQHAQLHAAAKARGLRVSQLLRARIEGERVPAPVVPQASREAWAKLAIISADLRRLTDLVDTDRCASHPVADQVRALRAVLEELCGAVRELRTELLPAK